MTSREVSMSFHSTAQKRMSSNLSSSTHGGKGKVPPGGRASYLAEILGVRFACRVEENCFLSDKILHYGTLGYAGARALSDYFDSGEAKKGTLWRPRILMVTNASVCLFATPTKETKASNIANAADGVDMTTICVSEAGERKLYIAFEDVVTIRLDPKSNDLIHINSSLIGDSNRKTTLRCSDPVLCIKLYEILVNANNAFSIAIDALKLGLLDEGNHMKVMTIIKIDEKYNTSESCACAPNLGDEVNLGVIKDNVDKAFVSYKFLLSTLHGAYCGNLKSSELLDITTQMTKKRPKITVACALINTNCSINNSSSEKLHHALQLEMSITWRKVDAGKTRTTSVDSYASTISTLPPEPTKIQKLLSKQATVSLPITALCFVIYTACISLMPMEYFKREMILAMIMFIPVVMILTASNPSASTVESTTDDELLRQEKTAYEFVVSLNKLKLMDTNSRTTFTLNKPKTDDDDDDDDDPDSEVVDPDDEELPDSALPANWLAATDGDRPEAIRQWRDSLQWRKDFDIDNMIGKKQPLFFAIKKEFCHVWLDYDKHGNLVTLEKFGGIRKNVQAMTAKNITPDNFAKHSVFLNEVWLKANFTETRKMTKIIDLGGASLGDIKREVINFFSPMNADMQQYPELVFKIFVVNSPYFIAMLWKLVSSLLAKKTTEKVVLLGNNQKAVKEALLKHIPAEVLPVAYGGSCTTDIHEYRLEQIAAEYVKKLNEEGFDSISNDFFTGVTTRPGNMHPTPSSE